jgi:hypothetical protein
VRLRKGPVLAGIGFGGILLCALVPEAAAWMAPALVAGIAAVSMAMRTPDDEGGGDGGSGDGRGVDQGGGEGAGDAGGDGGDGGSGE